MKIKYFMPSAALVLSLTAFAFGATKEELAQDAASENPVVAAEAVKSLRVMGREGLDSLFVKYAAEIKQYRETGNTTDNWRRIAAAIDTVAMQRDAYASNLYWHVDLDRAKIESQK